MEPIESVNILMDVAQEVPKSEPALESVLACKLCLAPQSAVRLTRRDLIPFYCVFRPCGLGLNIIESTHYNWVCQYCWVRASQCLKFIECARKAEHVLSNVFKHNPMTEEILVNVTRSYVIRPVALSLYSPKTLRINIKTTHRKRKKRRVSDSDDTCNEEAGGGAESDAGAGACSPAEPATAVEEQVQVTTEKCSKGPKKPRKDPSELIARWRDLEVEVIKLTEAEQLAELERRRRTQRYLDWRHKCHRCAVGFHELVSLERHNLSHDQARGPYECHICGVRFARQHQLSSHSGGHKRRWRCLRCGDTILKNDYLEAHRAKCTGSPPLRCEACGKFFSNKLRLRQHVSSSHNARRRHICDVCGREFKAKHHIRYHMRIHTGEMPYECELCGKKSSTSTSHRIHMTVHNKKTENPEAYCVECNKYFKNKNILQIHYQRSLKHNSKESFAHACTECEERYPAAAALRIHMNSAHLKTRSFQCALCDKAYYSQGTLAVHVREKHVGRERSREHACAVCRRAFLTSSQLKAHTRIHTKERPYVCPLCPATFTFNSGLYTHTKSKHKLTTAELKTRLGLAALGTPHTRQQLLERLAQPHLQPGELTFQSDA